MEIGLCMCLGIKHELAATIVFHMDEAGNKPLWFAER